jgi:SagB-type dehydrogenase family enzyme
MSKKKSPAPFPLQAVMLAVVFLLVGFIGGQYLDVNSFMVQEKEVVQEERSYVGEAIELPKPKTVGKMSVEEAMQKRRSRRAYTDEAVTLSDVSQLAWSLQGQTAEWGGRTVPSAKSAYPLEVTIVVKNVEGLDPGVYHYQPESHTITQVMAEVPSSFDEAAVQAQNKNAPVVFVLSGDYQKMTEAFDGKANDANVVLEAGHAGQNAYLQVESLGLATVVSGGFNKVLLHEVLALPAQEDLFYIIPVGVPAEEEVSH